jgi:ATP-dependent Lhr-like helicase
VAQPLAQSGEGKPFSTFERDLAERRQALGLDSRPVSRRSRAAGYRAAKRRVRQRLEKQAAARARWVGRWNPVHSFGVLGKSLPPGERVTRQTRQLLARYGIVTRACLDGEIGSWEWHLIYRQLQRMEMRGEVRRGYFVRGLPGLQFALPDVVERLRELRQPGADETPVVMNASDPANLYGPTREDGPLTALGEPLAFARVPTTYVVQHRGLPALVAGGMGVTLTTAQGVDEGTLQRALTAFLDHVARFQRRVKVETWNGDPVLESEGHALLEAVGFYRSYLSMEWERR